MVNLNLNKIKEEFNKLKLKIKKKKPILYILFFLIVMYFSFFGGAFLHESKILQKFNIFPVWFGVNDVNIDPSFTPVVEKDSTIIPFNLKNIGDKDLKDLTVTYSFCGLPSEKADLSKNILYKEESLEFNLKTNILLNTSCQIYTDKVWADVYLDSKENCYLDIPESTTKDYCEFCKVEFDIYTNNQKIHKEIWYPYLGDTFNTRDYATFVFTRYPLTITWIEGNKSVCKVLVPESPKGGLIKKEAIAFTFFDSWTMCQRGDDVEWCKENYYNKK